MTWSATNGYSTTGYRAAAVARQSGRGLPSRGSGDAFLRWDRDLLARMGDDFDRSNAIYAGMVNKLIDGAMGPRGFALSSETGDDALSKQIEGDWDAFGKAPEIRGIFNWGECQRHALRSVLNHGDLGVLTTAQQKFQYIESHRIIGGRRATANTRNGGRVEDGVEMDRFDTPKAYWVAPYDRSGAVTTSRAKRFRADSFVHVAHRKRFSQTRGVPALTEVFSMVHRISDVLDAEAIAWQLITKFAVSVTTEGGSATGYSASVSDDDGRDQPPDLADRYQEVQEGTFFWGAPGEKLEGINRNMPDQNFTESVRMYLRLIGMAIGLPLEVILMDYSQTNYTGARAALEQAWISFKAWQALIKCQHNSPLFTKWLSWRIAAGHYPDSAETYAHSWTAPEFPWIDQLKEAKGWGVRMDRGLSTHAAALKSLNVDRKDWLTAKKQEVIDARDCARQINTEDEDDTLSPVDWHMFAGHDAPPASSDFNGAKPVEEEAVEGPNDGGPLASIPNWRIHSLNGNGDSN